MELTDLERERYTKHLQLAEVGESGQRKLKASSVLVVGAGGLGSPVCLYLAAAGVGHLRIVDADSVSLSNLQRQVLHDTDSIGMPKVASAGKRLAANNPLVQLDLRTEAFSEETASRLVEEQQLVVDCTDNLHTRFTINEACVNAGIPMVYGAVFQFEGQVGVFDAKRGPCYRCLYAQIPDEKLVADPSEHGLLTTIPGVIGMLQANEVLKLLMGIGDPMIGRLLLFDGLSATFSAVRIPKNELCPVCGHAK